MAGLRAQTGTGLDGAWTRSGKRLALGPLLCGGASDRGSHDHGTDEDIAQHDPIRLLFAQQFHRQGKTCGGSASPGTIRGFPKRAQETSI